MTTKIYFKLKYIFLNNFSGISFTKIHLLKMFFIHRKKRFNYFLMISIFKQADDYCFEKQFIYL